MFNDFIYLLFDYDFFTIGDINTLCWIVNTTAIKVEINVILLDVAVDVVNV